MPNLQRIVTIVKFSGENAEKLMNMKILIANYIVGNNLKPIFHQNAKLLALGTFASPNAKYTTFALPDAKNTNMLVSLALGDANISRFTRRVLPDAFYPTPVSGI